MIEGYRDAAPAARSASVALYAYMALQVASVLLSLSAPAPDDGSVSLGDLVAILAFLALLACVVLVGRWILPGQFQRPLPQPGT